MEPQELEAPEDAEEAVLMHSILIECNTKEWERQDNMDESEREQQHERLFLDLITREGRCFSFNN